MPTPSPSSGHEFDADVVLVGAGIMSLTLATLLAELQPDWRIRIIDRLPDVAQESSNPWNNAGTGHSALCELNYTPERPDGSIDISSAVKVNEQFQVSRQLWASLVQLGVITDPSAFIQPVPHMSFVRGTQDVAYLKKRWDALKHHPLFEGMLYSENRAQIREWAPLLVEQRPVGEPIAATWHPDGSDVNFGALSKQLAIALGKRGVEFSFEQEVSRIRSLRGGGWRLSLTSIGRYRSALTARYVFVGAGGAALPLLQSSGIPEIRGYGGFPVSGQFLRTANGELTARLRAKVYGKAAVGSPPMSVPHLDTRVVDGERYLLFGPYAGFTPKYLKYGSYWDLVESVRIGNVIPMIGSGLRNLGLIRYLVSQLLQRSSQRLAALREFMPAAQPDDWELITAGQRVQVIKPNGTLQFGTEVIANAERGIAGLLGASPGASTAAPIMLDVLEKVFPDRIEGWRPTLAALVPSYGTSLSADAATAAATLERTARVLGLTVPSLTAAP